MSAVACVRLCQLVDLVLSKKSRLIWRCTKISQILQRYSEKIYIKLMLGRENVTVMFALMEGGRGTVYKSWKQFGCWETVHAYLMSAGQRVCTRHSTVLWLQWMVTWKTQLLFHSLVLQHGGVLAWLSYSKRSVLLANQVKKKLSNVSLVQWTWCIIINGLENHQMYCVIHCVGDIYQSVPFYNWWIMLHKLFLNLCTTGFKLFSFFHFIFAGMK